MACDTNLLAHPKDWCGVAVCSVKNVHINVDVVNIIHGSRARRTYCGAPKGTLMMNTKWSSVAYWLGLESSRSVMSKVKADQADDVVKMLPLDTLVSQLWSTIVWVGLLYEGRKEQQRCQSVLWLAMVGVILCGKLSEQRRCSVMASWQPNEAAEVPRSALASCGRGDHKRLWELQRWLGVLRSTTVGWAILGQKQREQQCCRDCRSPDSLHLNHDVRLTGKDNCWLDH